MIAEERFHEYIHMKAKYSKYFLIDFNLLVHPWSKYVRKLNEIYYYIHLQKMVIDIHHGHKLINLE